MKCFLLLVIFVNGVTALYCLATGLLIWAALNALCFAWNLFALMVILPRLSRDDA